MKLYNNVNIFTIRTKPVTRIPPAPEKINRHICVNVAKQYIILERHFIIGLRMTSSKYHDYNTIKEYETL